MSEPTDERRPNFDVLTRAPERRASWKRGGIYFLLLGLIAGTCVFSSTHGGWPAFPPPQASRDPLADVQQYLTSVALAGLLVTAQYFMLGGLLYGVYHFYHQRKQHDPLALRRWPKVSKASVTHVEPVASSAPLPVVAVRRWPVLLFGSGLAAVLCGIRFGQLPSLIALVLPGFGLLLGVWIVSNGLRGLYPTMWLVSKLAALAIAVTGLAGIAGYLATSDAPSVLESPALTAADKSRVAHLINSRKELGHGQERLHLTQRDVNLLMAAACEQLAIDARANAQVRAGAVGVNVSLGAPLGRYVNLQSSFLLEIQDGDVELQLDQLTIGKLNVPSKLLGPLGNYAVAVAKGDERGGAVIASIARLRFTDQQVEAVYHAKSLSHELKRAFHFHLGETQAVIDATSVHARYLVNVAGELPGGDEQFAAFLQTAFKFAQERSLRGEDPCVENRAAILALAIVLGHEHVETFVGNVTDNRTKVKARWVRGKVAVRRRRDWTRHFFVSAGLALTFDASVSDGAGLFKEEADSAEGGSGFSFSDLLADRAGVRFAQAATRDRAAAERMQTLLASPFSIDDIFPPASDLPEGLSDSMLEERFGGVNGEGYKQVIAEIERRLDTCQALERG